VLLPRRRPRDRQKTGDDHSGRARRGAIKVDEGQRTRENRVMHDRNAIGICSRSADRGGGVAPPAAVPSNRRVKRRDNPASPRPRTRSSNPVPSSRESTNFRFLRRAIAREEARRSGSRSGITTPQATTCSSTRRLLMEPGSKALPRPGMGIEKGDRAGSLGGD
jgi:hypothetical protein